jgi:hypothetical protein
MNCSPSSYELSTDEELGLGVERSPMAVTRLWMRSPGATILLLAVVLSLAACRDVGTAGGAGGGEMSLSIQEPEDGAEVSGKVNLAVSVEGTEIGPPDSGAMHIHVYVDDSDDYDVVSSAESFVSVPNGDHSLRVVLAQPNHEETQVSDEVTFSVSGATGDTEDTGGGYGGYG